MGYANRNEMFKDKPCSKKPCEYRTRPSQQQAPKFTKNCMCDKYTNCTDCQDHDTRIRKEALAEDRAKRELTIGDVYFYEAGLEAGRKEGADAEREKVLDAYIKLNETGICPNAGKEHLLNHCCDSEFCGQCVLETAIESLRAQSPKNPPTPIEDGP